MIRVGIPFTRGDNSWMGGVNYLANLVRAVSELPDSKIEIVLLVSPEAMDAAKRTFPSTHRISTDLLSGRSLARIASKGVERALGRNLVLEQMMRRHGITVISHTPPLGPNSYFPTVTWIPDFQYLHLPHLFTADQIKQRSEGLKRAVASHSLILFSSEQAKKDFASIAPGELARTKVLRFVSGMDDGEASSFEHLKAKYDLDDRYFHLPNQFWQHKNHSTALDAVKILAQRGIRAQIICTGHTEDFRSPQYFRDFQNRLSALGVGEYFRILGVVPYADVRGLMRHSTAVLNPSRFEGWSTSVEEAKSLGKTVLLSDIPVHREQAPAHASYFDVDSPEQLADLMARTLEDYSPARDHAQMAAAESALPKRFAEFGRAYEELIVHLASNKEKQRAA